MTTIYFEPDDEITTAITKIRAAGAADAVVVVPPGSKISTSRINFKLLAREAAERHMNLAAVSDEPQVRALAISAGLPAYDSIAGAERALATFREQDRRLGERVKRTMPRDYTSPTPGADPGATRVMPASGTELPSVAARRTTGYDSVPLDTAVLPAQQAAAARNAKRRRRTPIAPLLVLGLVVVLIAGVVYGAYVFLPTATITLRPAPSPVVAAPFTVTADPNVAVVDANAGVIPGQTVSIPVSASGTFTATGVDAHDVKASGSVTFKSENTVVPVSVPANTVVSTTDGVDFVTANDVVLPKASFATGPTTAAVDVHAVKGGTKGNVDANTITVVPSALSQSVVSVTNPEPTTGGKHVEDQIVSQDDYDAAIASLSDQLQASLAQALANSQTVPRGLTAFSRTAEMSAGQPDQPASALVGTAAPSFTLQLDATADVTAVNEAQINDIATARVNGAVAPGQKLVGNQVSVIHDAGTVVGDTVVYHVQASGQGYSSPDPQSLIAAVKGKSLTDARAALAQYGAAEIDVWPDFIDHMPDQPARISINVITPSAAPTAPPTLAPGTSSPSAS